MCERTKSPRATEVLSSSRVAEQLFEREGSGLHISRRSKVSILVALVSIFAIAGPFAATTYAASRSFARSSTPIKGVVRPAGSGSLFKAPHSSSDPQHARPKFQVNRLGVNGQVSSAGSNVPSAASLPTSGFSPVRGAKPKPGNLLQSFNGVSSLDNSSVNGFDLEPPDQGLCVGPISAAGPGNFVVEPVNVAYQIYAPNGTSITGGPIPLNFLFGESPAEFLSDPRCQFDPATQDFYFVVLAIDPSGLSSHFDVTVAEQSGNFMVYRFDTTDPTGPGCPCFGDQPLLGLDAYNIYVSNNEFPIATSPIYNGAEVYAISKSQLAALAFSVNFVEFPMISDEGILIETLQPAITYDAKAPAEYLLHSFTVDASGNNNSFDHRLGIFAITNQAAVTAGGTPTLSNPTIINSEAYAQPNYAANPNSFVLNADDDRMQQVQYINGNLMAALSTAVSIQGDTIPRDGAAWFDIEPSLHGSLTVKARIKHQGYIATSGLYILYPAIAQSSDGNVEMAFSISSSTINPSAAYAVVPDETRSNNAGAIFVAASGSGPDTGFTCSDPATAFHCRWGDYSWATLDPGTTNIWMASEYIPPVSSQSAAANWGTAVYEVSA